MDPTVITPPSHYRADAARFDEMIDAAGAPREHWSSLASAFADLGTEELLHRRAEVARLLDQDGAVYNAYGAGGRASPWPLDAVPTVISSREWTALETAVTERAELLALVLSDLYGERDLLRRGLLPAEVVFGHEGFERACDGTPQPLFCAAADLGRDHAGQWYVLTDRAQAPSGFGYALQNRTVVSRVLPSLLRDAGVHRLGPFFRTLRNALRDAAPAGIEDPRIVVLTPGPWNETAFEHAVLSSTLGYPLVEGSDLVARSDGVWMRSLGSLEPVHVILRRVDAAYCDPLELRSDSELGVPGLVEATRRGTVSVVNSLGSSVLENPALMRFLPEIAEHLTGRELELPCVPTWWCGMDSELHHVLANLERLVLRPITPAAGRSSVFASQLSEQGLDDLRRRVRARPREWVGQEPVQLGSVPTLTDTGLAPRRHVLRTFAVARGESFAVMPGGLTRVASEEGVGRISNQTGALSKDTWVLTSEPERVPALVSDAGPAVSGLDPASSLSARAAENLWWLGRYAERAEAVTRLLRIVHDSRNELQSSGSPEGLAALQTMLVALTRVTTTEPGFEEDGALAAPGDELRSLLVDDRRAGTVAHAVRAMLEAAYAVRDQLSSDTWLVVGSLDRLLLDLRRDAEIPAPAVRNALQSLMQGLLALSGLGEESMVRDLGWRFMDAGRRLERGLQLLALLRATLAETRAPLTDALVLESALSASESIITFRRRSRSHAQLRTALELLLLDPGNPRSLAFGLERLEEDLGALPAAADRRLRGDQRLVLQASTTLRLTEPATLTESVDGGQRPELAGTLDVLHELLTRAAAELDREQFVHRLPQRALTEPVASASADAIGSSLRELPGAEA